MKNRYLFLIILTFITFVIPGYLFSLVHSDYVFRIDLTFIVGGLLFAMILPLANRLLSSFVILIFCIMELIQFSHIFYFNTPLNVFSLHLMTSEVGEITETATSMLPWALYHVAIIILAYFLLAYFYFKIKIKTNIIASVLLVIILSILPYKAIYKTPRINNFMPKSDSVSIINSLKTFTAYFCIYLPNHSKDIKNYEEYSYTQNNVDNKNIVLIIGESVNANHISLLGYEKETNPLLKEFAKTNELVAKKAISSSVLTRVSLPMFINISYNHDDIKHILNEKTNLFRLAKLAGFKTFYISDQTQAEATALSPKYMDVIYTKEDYPLKAEKIGDMILLEKLEEFINEFNSGKNFIVLHQRNAHSPYEKGYRGYLEAGVYPIENLGVNEYKINSYDNAMIFNDKIIFSIFEAFKNLNNPSYLMFVPDHSEAIGEIGANNNAEWGHAFLSKNVANIPIFATSFNTNKEYLDSIKALNYPTHYELGKILAKELGFNIVNPNEIKDVFFINGVDIAGSAGYIKVIKNKDSVEFIYNN